MELSELDRKIINRLSGDLPSDKTPFATLAREIGLDETVLLEKIGNYAKTNVLRRFAAILAHQNVGFVANAMVVWRVPEESVVETGQTMARFGEVSHCYERLSYPQWRYNIYTMIHGRDREQCLKVVERISAVTGIHDYKVLFTVREFKKTSMRYFG
ncbi:MAG: Lrp/AsnC family transcriptional regulator [Candidatus Hydrogenedentes bacterium]|jgi:DNA-binding Lrp family transcriptional regulator|nr:Lrp/AsnC family transcriptional regulator [Candidatus Hydrogenedentota bacterium]